MKMTYNYISILQFANGQTAPDPDPLKLEIVSSGPRMGRPSR